jgi:hypothetical protein
MDHEVPFHDSTRVWLVPKSQEPTATQSVELVHDTRSSPSEFPSLGLEMIDQEVPFHDSTKVWRGEVVVE